MELEQHKEILDNILLESDQANKSKMLETLREDYIKITGDLKNAMEEQERLQKENTTFSKVNSELFLKVGEIDKSIEDIDPDNPTETDAEKPPEKLKYEDLVLNKYDMEA